MFKEEQKDIWKREVAEVLKKHGIVDSKTVGRIAFNMNGGNIVSAVWQDKRID